MCHVAQATSEYLCGQLLAVTIDLADGIVTVCRLVGHGVRLDYIIAAGVTLLSRPVAADFPPEGGIGDRGISPCKRAKCTFALCLRGLTARGGEAPSPARAGLLLQRYD